MGNSEPLPFTYAYYEKMFRVALDSGYHISSFVEYDSSRPRTIILRHDVDYTLNGVARLALIEKELGITATYMFRVHADEYNLFSPVSRHIVGDIIEMGHEIGLHFEAMNVGRALGIAPEELLRREKTVIEAVLGFPVRTCSEHREVSGSIHHTPLYEEAYDPLAAGFEFYSMEPRFFKEMKYLSDSNACWREGDLLQHLGRHERFQVLVHADWWFDKDLLLKGPYFHPRGVRL